MSKAMPERMLVKPTIAELRQLIGEGSHPLAERSSFSLYPEGLAKASLIEVTGRGKTEWIALFLKENPSYRVAWVESELSINPYALFQKQVDLSQVLFIEAANEVMWCLTQALSSGCFQVMITDDYQMNEKEMRRCQLLSEKHQVHFFMLSEQGGETWVPRLKLNVTKNKNQLRVTTLKKRGLK